MEIHEQLISPDVAQGEIDIGRGLKLRIRSPHSNDAGFPTSRLAKGLVICCGGRELVEEGLGFGVPLLKYGSPDVFPGSATFEVQNTASESIITVDFELNLVKKMALKGKTITNRAVYKIEDALGRLHRALPALRKPGNRIFGKLRSGLGLKSVFDNVSSSGCVQVRYIVPSNEPVIHVEANLLNVERDGLTEIIIANEQGAGYFGKYRDSDGLSLEGDRIGTWDEVKTGSASFIDSRDNFTFSLQKIDGVKLFRGRELEAGRLAWAGLNYVLTPDITFFAYDILMENQL